MYSTDVLSSREIVAHMVRVLGEAKAANVLAVTPARFAAFLAGRGRLAEAQVNRIAVHTRKPWPLWVMDACEAKATTPEQRAYIADGQVMREFYERYAADDVAKAEAALAAGAVPSPTLKPIRSRASAQTSAAKPAPVRRRRATA